MVLQLLQNGRLLHIGALARWATGHGWPLAEGGWNGLSVPALAPGDYRLCLGPMRTLMGSGMSTMEWADTQAKCTEGRLPAGGALVLEAPELERERQ